MNFIQLFVCFAGCILFGLSDIFDTLVLPTVAAKIGGLYLALQGAALFVVSEIRDIIK